MKESWKKKTKTSSAIFEVTEKDILQSCSRLSRCGSWEIFRVFGFDTKWQQVLRLYTIRVLVLGEIAPCLCAQAIGFAPWPACPVCHNTIFGALLIVADSSVMVRIAICNTADERGRGTCNIIIKCFWILLKDSWISLNLLSRTLGRTIRILPSHPRNPHATGLSSLALPSQSFPPFACQKWFSFLRDWLGCRTLRIPCCSLQNDLWTWMRQRLAKDATYFFAPAASKSWLPAPFLLLVHKLYENFTSYNLVFQLLVGKAPRILFFSPRVQLFSVWPPEFSPPGFSFSCHRHMCWSIGSRHPMPHVEMQKRNRQEIQEMQYKKWNQERNIYIYYAQITHLH